jgi:putative membrane protein insertion efficiency factor
MGTKQGFVNLGLKTIIHLPARLVVFILGLYHRWISPLLGPVCRFYPSCSVYAVEVISSFGLVRGGWLTIRRLLRCHPFHPGGIDLPPKPRSKG